MTDILKNLTSLFGKSTSIVSPVADFRPSWLDTFTREQRTFLLPRAGIQGPYPEDAVEYEEQYLEPVVYDVRVYRPVGHSVGIVLTEEYAAAQDAMRDLAEAALHSDDARSRWSVHPLRHRAKPEDFQLHLDELPDSSYIGELYLLDWDNPFDPWQQQINGNDNRSLAAATSGGNVEFYRGELNGFLGLNLKHEWCHLLQARFPQLVAAFNNAVNIEWWEWIPDASALKAMGEQFAYLGQNLMHRDGAEFLRVGFGTVVRTVAFFDVLEQSLNAAARPCAYESVWRERIRVVKEELLTLAAAKAAERLQVATDTTAYLAALAARQDVATLPASSESA